MDYIPFPQISPEIFTLTLGDFSFSLRWYALAYIAGLLIGWRMVMGLMKRPALWGGDAPVAPGKIEDLLSWIILGVILGGRLGFVLFYQPGFYLSNPGEILKIWEGGMSFHGGFLGVVAGAWAWAARQGVAPLKIADALALAAPVGLFFGRIANFINAELWGRPTDLPWGVAFPGAGQDCFGVTGICARHPSQLYEAVLEGLLLGAVLLWGIYRRGWLQLPGRSLGVFLAGYGAARFFVEFFREADAQFITAENLRGAVFAGMSMGQLLSLPMILAGLYFILRARSRAV